MHKPLPVFGTFLLVVMLAACAAPTTAVPTPGIPTLTPITIPTLPAATSTLPPVSPTSPPAQASSPTAPPVPQATATASAGSGETSQPAYLDDRSTATGLIQSLFNAVSRHEYLRAYSYWRSPEQNPNVGTFAHFQQGYQDTASVEALTGTVSSDAGAGQRYYTVPVVLLSRTNQGQSQTFSGCYTLHLSSPDIQGVPPFQPLAIESATVKPAAAGAKSADLLSAACQGVPGYQPGANNPVPTTSPQDLTAQNYLDDRSDPVQVLRSLFNAINRKEYVRAYSYWQFPALASAQPYNQFVAGYQDTASVQANFGTPTSDAGAGQIRYRVPVSMTVQTTQGKTQFFAGCYQLHLSQPAIQGVPPFQPLGIETASVQQVTSAAEASTAMATACAKMP